MYDGLIMPLDNLQINWGDPGRCPLLLLTRFDCEQLEKSRVHSSVALLPLMPGSVRAVYQRGGLRLREPCGFACRRHLGGCGRAGRPLRATVGVIGHHNNPDDVPFQPAAMANVL